MRVESLLRACVLKITKAPPPPLSALTDDRVDISMLSPSGFSLHLKRLGLHDHLKDAYLKNVKKNQK